jgi:multiple sugar transport system permease protein
MTRSGTLVARLRKALRKGPSALWSTLVLIWLLFPIYFMIATSFKRPIDIASRTPLWIFQPTLRNYEHVVDGALLHYLLNSVIVAASSTILSTALGSLAAYGLARLPLRGKKHYAFWILSMRMLPPIVGVIPLFYLFKAVSLTDTIPALILAYATFNVPFATWMMLSFFQDLPMDIEEAALVDGASRLQVFRWVALPLAAPGLVVTAIFALIFSWNEFLFALVLTSSERAQTMPILIASFVQYFEIAWGEMMAVATLAALPVLIFALFVQRYLVRGLAAGAFR